MGFGCTARSTYILPQSGALYIGSPPYPMRGAIFTYSAPASCLDLYTMYPSARTSGIYTVSSGPVYCDMSTNAVVPGWTLIAMTTDDPNDQTWGYTSNLWTSTATTNPTTADITQNVNMKNQAFNTIPFAAIRFVFGTPSANNPGLVYYFQTPVSSALSIFSGGYVNTGFSRTQFNTALGPAITSYLSGVRLFF